MPEYIKCVPTRVKEDTRGGEPTTAETAAIPDHTRCRSRSFKPRPLDRSSKDIASRGPPSGDCRTSGDDPEGSSLHQPFQSQPNRPLCCRIQISSPPSRIHLRTETRLLPGLSSTHSSFSHLPRHAHQPHRKISTITATYSRTYSYLDHLKQLGEVRMEIVADAPWSEWIPVLRTLPNLTSLYIFDEVGGGNIQKDPVGFLTRLFRSLKLLGVTLKGITNDPLLLTSLPPNLESLNLSES